MHTGRSGRRGVQWAHLMKAHLLFRDRDFDFGADLPPNHEDLVADLELRGVLEAMAAGDTFLFDVARRLLLSSVCDRDTILYRQHIVADSIAHPALVRQMYAIAAGALRDARRIWGGYSGTFQTPRSRLTGAVDHFETYVTRLKELRKVADEHATTFESDGLRALLSSLQENLDDDYFAQIASHLERLRFRAGVLISAELDRDNSGINFVLRTLEPSPASWRSRLGLGPRISYSFTLPPRDDAGGDILSDLTSRGINLVANAAAQSADHVRNFFIMLCWELGFYVGCINLRDRLAERDAPTSFPEPAPPGSPVFSCVDLRDASLVLRAEPSVVGNDVAGDRRTLFIITGANSGGKSTFLRSVGQAQLMMQCGLFVNARAFNAGIARSIFTHFLREEDASMTSGRLDDELSRMSSIADRLHPHSVVLFNESFAGTNEREGSEIARQVVTSLLEAGVKVFFVTHQFDFSRRFLDTGSGSTLFLRADRLPDGRRTFKLAAKEPLPTSFGEDVYYRSGGWFDGADKPAAGGTGRGSRPSLS